MRIAATFAVVAMLASGSASAQNGAEAILNGQTFASEPIQGADAINIKQQMSLRGLEEE